MTAYANPVLPGFHPDPSLCRVGEDYYLVTSTFEYLPGIPVHHSRDLVHWRLIGHVLTRPGLVDLAGAPPSRGIWAPTLRHHDGVFYVVGTNFDRHGKLVKFLATATDPAGPWSEPLAIDQPGIDPSLLFDTDGRVYLTTNAFEAAATPGIYQAELDPRTGRLLSDNRLIWTGSGECYPEGPHLYRIGDWYYLTIAEGGCQYGHIQTIARSRSPWGPFEACPRNPILTHRKRGGHPIQGVGHVELIEDHRGRWWAFCLAFRNTTQFFHHLGRETFLAPVVWDADGWPVIGSDGTLELAMDADLPPAHPWPEPPVRETFAGPALPLGWHVLREYRPQSFQVGATGLILHPGPQTLDDLAPVLLCRPQTAWTGSWTTAVDLQAPTGTEAGLTVLYHNEHHYEIAVVAGPAGQAVRLRRRIGDLQAVVAEVPAPAGTIHLQIQAEPERYRFRWAAADGAWHDLGTGATQFLSTEAVRLGFTGVHAGLYATTQGAPAAGTARFAWCETRFSP